MVDLKGKKSKLHKIVVLLSVLLLFFTIPHTLEDFATGEPAKAGIPAPVLSFVVAMIFAIQAIGLHWLGEKQRRGYLVQVGISLSVLCDWGKIFPAQRLTEYRSNFPGTIFNQSNQSISLQKIS